MARGSTWGPPRHTQAPPPYRASGGHRGKPRVVAVVAKVGQRLEAEDDDGDEDDKHRDDGEHARRLRALGEFEEQPELAREGVVLRCAGKAGNPFQTTQGNRLSCRDQEDNNIPGLC